MKLPNADQAGISQTKITDYLLSPVHTRGRHKAKFFESFGFDRQNWIEMADALKLHARLNDVARVEASRFGSRYVIEGPIESPDGRCPRVRAIWFISRGATAPYFVTAYPMPEVKP
jgi:hypothetical protein